MRSGSAPPIGDRPARIVFALLVVASFAAFFLAQRLKHTPTVVQSFERTPSFSPTAKGRIKQERISFKIAQPDLVTVTIVNAKGDVVATLVRDQPVARYKQFSLRWNGRSGAARRYTTLHSANGHSTLVPENEGALAPPGEYRVHFDLREQSHEVFGPRSFTLVGG
ncbi:MAG TPA: hypothetical protein VNY34_06610 [Solirubrobacteraceae bacterium]|nr:hypothetical protein [Solirubrobacteraceae bacterium]